MKRSEILEAAKKCVCGEREEQYGGAEDNFCAIAALWDDYLFAAKKKFVGITAKDVPLMMSLLKIARASTGHGGIDSWIDLAGYAARGGEIYSILEGDMEAKQQQ